MFTSAMHGQAVDGAELASRFYLQTLPWSYCNGFDRVRCRRETVAGVTTTEVEWTGGIVNRVTFDPAVYPKSRFLAGNSDRTYAEDPRIASMRLTQGDVVLRDGGDVEAG